ncbi:UPF0348 protein YlbM [Paenibacillus sp. J31TS4]|uniref:nucleotidyltransferase n=1 Tax=Paenibacillus sp. J31TS4 TaxID=2807195 RepID=UPI001B029C30|nr:nucleotidyltransferase [Paenibacillus sp. J31TS4]GIP36757.1 UPF0348 protein YlbM [Paenibacillus sp. J31TS4]
MRTVGLIVEYNPLHNGHVYHFEQAKRLTGAEAAVAVMSGHFLQRGEPAVVGKWARAEMALRMGADLVLELPVAYACQPAEWFAYGAVATLERTGVVDALCFGSESGDLAWLSALADGLSAESAAFRTALAARLKQGLPYPAAYGEAAGDTLPEADARRLAEPNNTLGLHYLLALRRLGSRIEPATVTRHKAGYHDREAADARIASATALRRMLGEDGLEALRPYVPHSTYEVLTQELAAGRGPVDWDRFVPALLHQLVTRPAAELESLAEVREGLEHRILQALPRLQPAAGTIRFEELLAALKTKRYTRTKLQRTLLRILLNHRKDQLARPILAEGPSYLRVLGFTSRGQALLKRMKRTATRPVIAQAGRFADPLFELDVRATAVYALGYANPHPDELFRDYYQPPVRAD